MLNPVDAFGNNLYVGDVITYAVKQSTEVAIRRAVILEIRCDDENDYSPYSLHVEATTRWNNTYTTVLTSNAALVKINREKG